MKKLSITKTEVLDFEVVDLLEEEKKADNTTSLDRAYNIAVAGTGYVGLSMSLPPNPHATNLQAYNTLFSFANRLFKFSSPYTNKGSVQLNRALSPK